MFFTKRKFSFPCKSTKQIANIIFGCAKSCSQSLYYRGQNLTAAWQINVRFVVQGYKKYYNFQIYPSQNTLLTASILEAQIKNSLCFSLNESSVFRAGLQNKLQTLFLGVQNHVLCLFIIEGKISQQLDKSKFCLLCSGANIFVNFNFGCAKILSHCLYIRGLCLNESWKMNNEGVSPM